ncbi:hypothetical protein ZIOFF_049676 [Zingiber officinale]|uniref:Band 7 domain-containing protein n=1 Tax=Zingiber officinale TaxID=94328 RepID=A0A8J5KT43_ZINOF|nr:hypothetical protein ZIOFF_049676 [Zingiber officinale]
MAMLLKARRLFRRVVVAAEAAVQEYRRHQSRDDLLYSRSEATIPFHDSLLYSNSKYEQQPINWGIRIVLENKINVVERFGKYHRILESGIHILIPFIVDPILASYGVAGHPIFMVIQLTETTMKDELGKITLDQMFEEKDALNESIACSWDISLPPEVLKMKAADMMMQAEVERRKRARVLESEVEEILNMHKAIAKSLDTFSQTINGQGGAEEARQRVYEQCVQAIVQTAKAKEV